MSLNETATHETARKVDCPTFGWELRGDRRDPARYDPNITMLAILESGVLQD
jgi:hypothetical protein